MKILYQTRKKIFFLSMKSVKLHSQLSRLVVSSLVFLFLFSFNLSAQDADVANGEKLFKSTCAACHRLDKKLVGPALKGITEKREQEKGRNAQQASKTRMQEILQQDKQAKARNNC